MYHRIKKKKTSLAWKKEEKRKEKERKCHWDKTILGKSPS